MASSPSDRGRHRPLTDVPLALLRALAVLGLGFLAMSLGPVQAAFEGLATALAALSHLLLSIGNGDLVRTGSELRDTVAGWAVDVTSVCDGHGLLIGWLALLAALTPPPRRALTAAVGGILAIQLFNLVRIVVLALVLGQSERAFVGVHLFAFPLLTGILLAALALTTARQPGALVFAVLAVGLSILWVLLAGPAAHVAALLANGLLALGGPAEVGEIAQRSVGWTVGSSVIAETSPLAFLLAPLDPADFLLPAPLLVASLIAARPGWRDATLAGAGFLIAALLAIAIAAVTSIAALADAYGLTQIAVPSGAGTVTAEPYAAPGETTIATLRLTQNMLVHLNLLVLPALVLLSGPPRR
ncbi:hypothetical protein [Pelagovum pacificum]|uniref:Exosortase/archaeosortase family protein n=1 Tax=Pelagovum pacificum TaxID=2588711 RepID=A0A5C5GH81_9RHOB|nr:hypothetical protein [Pelagovum pacificum]QQA43596.1 hypothetical protein I8N54_03190 [Pelagovum pacificum]TNY33269.1 hypothetical protein FHY64_08340 [Pelagovum pacificum]